MTPTAQPLAAIFAFAVMAALWLPTLAHPVAHAAAVTIPVVA